MRSSSLTLSEQQESAVRLMGSSGAPPDPKDTLCVLSYPAHCGKGHRMGQ